MRDGLLSSFIFHVMAVLIAYFGVPALFKPAFQDDYPIVVDFVQISHKTNLPKLPPPSLKPKRKPAAERQKPSQISENPLPRKPVAKPKPLPKPKVEKPVAKPKPLPKLKVEKPVAKPKLRPKPKEAAPDPFASVLKTVEKFRQPEEKVAAKPTPEIVQAPKRFDVASRLTLSELDAIRSQISRCWNVPVGAMNAEDLIVEIRVHVNPDGTIRKARILDAERMQHDPFFRTAAESAYRAVINPRCSPLRLPPEKYELWKIFTLSFNPKEMLGT